MADTAAVARWLAGQGMHLFPLDHPSLPMCAGIRTPQHDPATCKDRGKHPCVKWSVRATTDPREVDAAFTGAPRNIGVACGPSGLVVIDEDVPGDLAKYAASIGQTVPATFTVVTGKGSHFWFRQPAGQALGNKEGELKAYGCNVRGAGGYVVGPGSTHATGVEYHPVAPDTEILPCPDWLVTALAGRAAQPSTAAPVGESTQPSTPSTDDTGWWRAGEFSEGSRHNAMVAAAGWCRQKGLSHTEAVPVLRDVWRRCLPGDPTYTWDDALAKLTDIYARYEDGRGHKLATEVERQRLQREARRTLDAEERPAADPPELLTLAERLARPRPALVYRVDGWQPTGSRVVLAAQFKAGKTTLVGNLVRSLVDGDPFLGRHLVAPVAGTVAVLDFEMSEHQLVTWLEDQKIRNPDRVMPVPLRGRGGAFDILDPERRAEWATRLRYAGSAYLVLDCLRPVLDALGLDEHHDAGRFLVALDALLGEAGVGEAAVIHHMGHANERSRGDSRIRDWPDVEWRLVRQDDNPASPRYLSGYGRDVDQPEAQLDYDPATRHLTLVGGTRGDAAKRGALGSVISVLRSTAEMSGRAIEDSLDGMHGRNEVRRALAYGLSSGALSRRPGERRAHLYSIAASVNFDPDLTEGEGVETPRGQSASAPECADSGGALAQVSAPLPIGRRTSALLGTRENVETDDRRTAPPAHPDPAHSERSCQRCRRPGDFGLVGTCPECRGQKTG